MAEKTKIELLSPAKNKEYGMTAIRYGADAVYIAAESFGARAAAGNSIEDIAELCSYAHQFSAKVYATVNTLIYDHELPNARETVHKLYDAGADAIIIQDMAFLQMDLPPIPIFASTQVHNYEPEKIQFLETCGIKRFILARELNLSQIEDIKNKTEAELEAFVHGALCVSFSGRCYMSAFETGRSGNRGECSQLCRMKYDLLDHRGNAVIKDKYLLSTKDLNLSDYLEKLICAGITSLKIEGRLKDINYVKNITAFYRKKLDAIFENSNQFEKSSFGNISMHFEPQPDRSFNRGFTNYFIDGRTDSVINPRSPKSLGQYLGRVVDVRNRLLKIETNELITSGDGLCYFDEEDNLVGFYVNKVEAKGILPNKEISITIGAEVFRNQDFSFDKLLEQDKTERKIDVFIDVDIEQFNSIVFKAHDLQGNSSEYRVAADSAKSCEIDKSKTISEQLSKSGGTIFYVQVVNFAKEIHYSLPKSELNSIRRLLLNGLKNNILANYSRIERKADSRISLPNISEADYTENVANSMSEAFYAKHKINVKQKAFELLDERHGLLLMTTKHCLKYEVGDCPKLASNNQLENAKTMFLESGRRKYRLEFSCKECVMKIYAK